MAPRLHRSTVQICGAGHSGSTLLGLVLGSHSSCFYAGELEKSTRIGDPKEPPIRRGCKICGDACPVWSRFSQPPEPDLYEALAQLTGKPIIVDSSKPLRWIRPQLDELDRLGVPVKLIFLLRDGRAVVNSRVRKYGRERASEHIAQWIEQIRATEALAEERPAEVLKVRYEALATDPRPIIERACSFLGLAFEPDMLRYEAHAHHPISGNTGTQSVVARARHGHAGVGGIPEISRDYYEPMDGGFHLDLRWTHELPHDILQRFEEEAGAVNEPYRWDPA